MGITPIEKRLVNHFGQYITSHKKEMMEWVLEQRTRHVTVVLEDIYQSQNASAVVRTCECMGIQDLYIIENRTAYEVNKKVLKGSYKWMNLIRFKSRMEDNTAACFRALRARGYTIAITDPEPGGMEIQDVDPAIYKLALVFGNEERGVSEVARQQADLRVKIPMYGFTESYNISVSVAICLHSIMPVLRKAGIAFGLTEEEKDELRLQWYRKVIRRADLIEKGFLKANQ
jgi:tRNA (guanosine-2'-O-)-methyltransferase